MPPPTDEKSEALRKLQHAVQIQAFVLQTVDEPYEAILALMMAALSTAVTHRKPDVTDEMIIAAMHQTVEHGRKIMPLLNQLNDEAEKRMAMEEKQDYAQH